MSTDADTPRETHPAPQIAVALRRALRGGYSLSDLRSDVLAGVVVGVVALPLAMALAVATGVPPQYGLYTAIVGGAVIALLGGSKVQVSGPTAAFIVILAPIAQNYGLGGLLVATMLAGAMQILMGMTRLGRLIEFIPHPVTTGFTAGIAVVIATLQVKDFFGLRIESMPPHYIEKVLALWNALRGSGVHWPDLALGVFTLALLLVLPRLTRAIPAPIIALPVAALVALLLPAMGVSFPVETIRTRFPETGGVPQLPPVPLLPWGMPGPGGEAIGHQLLDVGLFKALLTSAFAIAILGAIESLLSAVVADGMTGKRHDPDAELIAQGAGNVIAPLFGGFAATGAIARTATNIRSGARSPIAAIVHSLFILAAVLLAAPLLGYLPMASMAALLLIIARNMSEVRHFVHVLRVAPRSDVLVMLTCFFLTVIFDMVIAVSAGVVLAALLFMGRMAAVSTVRLVADEPADADQSLPAGVLHYRVAGPLFFGAAHRAMSALHTVQSGIRAILLDMRDVPVMDATALVNLESVLDRLHQRRVFVIIAGAQPQPLDLMARAGWKRRPWVVVWRKFDDAVALLRTLTPSDFDGDVDLHALASRG